MRPHARGTLSGFLSLALFACGGKTNDHTAGTDGGTGGSGGASVAAGGSRGGVPSSSSGGSLFVGFDASPPRPPIDSGPPVCLAPVPLLYGGDIAPCAWKIPELPPGRVFDPDKVNVQIGLAPEGTPLYQTRSLSDCGDTDNTWFYDDEKSPTSLALCPRACDQYLASLGERLYFTLGCASTSGPPMH